MIKQIFIDDMTGEEITGEVYQIELSTVRGGDIDIPDDINAIRNGMHFSLDSISKILTGITRNARNDSALEIAEKRIRGLETEINQLRQLKAEFSPKEEKVVPYEPPRIIPGQPEEKKEDAEKEEPTDIYDSIKGIDEGRLKALYEAGWNNKDLGVEFGRSNKAISNKISIMIKQGKLQRRSE